MTFGRSYGGATCGGSVTEREVASWGASTSGVIVMELESQMADGMVVGCCEEVTLKCRDSGAKSRVYHRRIRK